VTSFPALSKQSRKKGSTQVTLHLWSLCNARNAHDVGRNARNVGLDPDGLHRGSNVFHQSIHPVGRTHETLHRRTLFLDTYVRPIHTHIVIQQRPPLWASLLRERTFMRSLVSSSATAVWQSFGKDGTCLVPFPTPGKTTSLLFLVFCDFSISFEEQTRPVREDRSDYNQRMGK
jgi:hypothetical protein